MRKSTLVAALLTVLMLHPVLTADAALAKPDLAVSVTDSADPAKVYYDLTYIITVVNNGAGADGVAVKGAIPAGTSFKSVETSKGSCSGSAASCTIGRLGSGESAQVSLVVSPSRVGDISFAASASLKGSDWNNANNSDSEATQIVSGPIADLAVSSTASAVPPKKNDFTGVVVTVQNFGPEASWAWLEITLPEGLSHIASGPDCRSSSTWVICRASSSHTPLVPGQSSTFYVVVRAMELGTHLVTARVSSGGYDPQLSNNTSSTSVTVEGTDPGLALPSEPASNLKLMTGYYSWGSGSTNFYMNVVNNGTLTAEDVKLTSVPWPNPDAKVTSVDTSQGTCESTDAQVSCTLGKIAAEASASVTITVYSTPSIVAAKAAYVDTSTLETSKADNESYALALGYWPEDPDRDDDSIPDVAESFICNVVLQRTSTKPTWCYYTPAA